jgi:hypothetical protein
MQTKKQRDEWYLKNKERINEKRNIHYVELKQNPEWFKNNQKNHHNNYLKNRTKRLEDSTNYYNTVVKKNPEMIKRRSETARKWDKENRRIVIDHYSYGENCCMICRESDIDVLTIDHINGGGNQHRKILTHRIEKQLIKDNFPEGYRILCMNCNMKEAKRKGFYGTKIFKK